MTVTNDQEPYIIISKLDKKILANKVNEYIQKGYLPVGGVSYRPMTKDGQWTVDACYMQSMILKPYMIFIAH